MKQFSLTLAVFQMLDSHKLTLTYSISTDNEHSCHCRTFKWMALGMLQSHDQRLSVTDICLINT